MGKWHCIAIQDIFSELDTKKEGLPLGEVNLRLQKYGFNKLPEAKTDSLFSIFLRQFQNPLIYILLVAALVVFTIGEVIDGSIIVFVLLFNAIVGTFQEGKAQNTLLALKKFSQTTTLVRRGGHELLVSDYELVLGDIIILREGDKIPADCRIFESNNLTVDESSLTGESNPVQKQSEELERIDLQISDQKNMVFKGTNIVAGNGLAVVVATGLNTVLGKISQKISVIDTEMPLKTNIRNLTRLIIIVVLLVCSTIFILGVALGHTPKEMFVTVVSLAVSIVPEGLPIVMTLVLATGVWRMSKRNALIKKLQAVEALGQARVIAVDKTGTLTKNEISIKKIFVNNSLFSISGEGYSPEGEILLEGRKIDPHNFPELELMGRISALVSNQTIVFNKETNIWEATGDPTEGSLSAFAHKINYEKEKLEQTYPRVAEIPFNYKNKYHAVSHTISGRLEISIAGASEVVLERSSEIWDKGSIIGLSDQKRLDLEKILSEMSGQGYRVLALGIKEMGSENLKDEDIHDLTFVGFVGLRDTLRPDIKNAVEKAESAGMKVVMITGDHKLTAEAIAREAGILHEGDMIITGEEIDHMEEHQLSDILDKISVFARVTPEHKLKIVEAYKAKNIVIAMTGDGVNDAPSLVAADLGISMGRIGTEVAKEASDIVLLDDNFNSIIAAIEEGRNIYKTIKKVILYLFSTSFGEVFTITVALILGMPLPILAAQIIWLNFVTDGFLDISLAMEPKEDDLLNKDFEKPKKYLLDRVMITRMFIMATTMMVGTLILFSQYYLEDLTKALTVSLTTLAAYQWFNAWNCRHESKSIFQMNLFSNKYLLGSTFLVIVLQIFGVYSPVMQDILHTKPLDLHDWALIIPMAASIIVVEEIRKFILRKFN